MRINIYSQEIDLVTPVEIIAKDGTDDAGKPATFYGIRFWLHSAPELHFNDEDDDRSAVTFWLPKSNDNRTALANQLMLAGSLIKNGVVFGFPEAGKIPG